jgi:4-hydroxybenzoate polyprenyltransferase
MTEVAAPSVPDSTPGNWVDTSAPAWLRPYLRLARVDRPIGAWLLLLPCWWSDAAANIARQTQTINVWHLVLFAIGAVVMRGAGCAYNDFVDRDIDGLVERTRTRPIPSGQVTAKAALAFAVGLSLIGMLVLLRFNDFTIGVGIASLVLVAIYPFMKRYTYWPQLVLGLTFTWGALVGWAAVTASLSAAPLLLYAGAVAWVIGYDTIYAHQDAEDDLMAGLKSTALKFGESSPVWVSAFYAIAIVLWTGSATLIGADWPTYAALAAVAVHFAWQVSTLDIHNAQNCLARFRSNRDAGLILFAGLLVDALT